MPTNPIILKTSYKKKYDVDNFNNNDISYVAEQSIITNMVKIDHTDTPVRGLNNKEAITTIHQIQKNNKNRITYDGKASAWGGQMKDR